MYLDIFSANGLDYPRVAVFASEPGARLNLVATGRFLSIHTSVLRLSRSPDIKALPVKLQHTRAPVGIITLRNHTLSPAAQLFIDEAREVAKPLGRRSR
jgi:DNA-binding transcriptional LysR family regulator